jgi:hypothetical protein
MLLFVQVDGMLQGTLDANFIPVKI